MAAGPSPAQSVRLRHRALDLGLADAVNVALAADYDTDGILTLDRCDFRAVRPSGHHKAFRVLPDDLQLSVPVRAVTADRRDGRLGDRAPVIRAAR